MQIIWSNHSLEDLARLHAFLSPVNPLAAADVFEMLATAPDILQSQPRIGAPLNEFLPREVRFLIVGDYEIRYEVTQTEVWILRLWHTKEDR